MFTEVKQLLEDQTIMKLIHSIQEIGEIVRNHRKAAKLSQKTLAAAIGVGNRFIVDLERGKETIEFGKALYLMNKLGIELFVKPKAKKGREDE